MVIRTRKPIAPPKRYVTFVVQVLAVDPFPILAVMVDHDDVPHALLANARLRELIELVDPDWNDGVTLADRRHLWDSGDSESAGVSFEEYVERSMMDKADVLNEHIKKGFKIDFDAYA